MKSKQKKTDKYDLKAEVRAAAAAESGDAVFRYPEKKPLRRAVKPPAKYPVEALGERLAPVAEALADVTQGPVEACAQVALSVANAAVQGLVDVEMPHSIRPISLNTLCILPSGERKSAIFSAATVGIRSFEEQLRVEYERAAEMREEGLKVPLPPLPVVTVTEQTIDGIVKFLTTSRAAILLASDEAAVFANSHSMAPKDLMRTCALYSSLWDAAPIMMARAATDHRFVSGVRVGMCLMAQPPAVAQLLTNAEAKAQGILGRFLMCMPPSRVGARFYSAPSEASVATLKAFHARVHQTLEIPLPERIGGSTGSNPRRIRLGQKAVDVFAAFHDEVESKVVEGQRYFPIREFACKAAEHAVRIAATIAMFHNRKAETLTAARMADGVTLARYYLGEALRIASAEGDVDLLIAEKTLAWIERRGRAVLGTTEMYRTGPPEIRKAVTARRIANILIDHGYLAHSSTGVEIGEKICEGFLVL